MTELCHTGRGLSEEFDDDFQNRLAAYFCRDHEFLTRAGDLVAPNQFSNAANAILVNMVSGYYRMYKSAPSSSAILDMLKRAKRDKTIREELFPDVVEAFKRILAEKLSDTAYMVDQVEDLRAEWLEGARQIGLTAGASAPEALVDQVVARLKALGAVAVRQLDGVTESVQFPLPRGLVVKTDS